MRLTGDLQKDIKIEKKKKKGVLANLTAERAKKNKSREVWPGSKKPGLQMDSLVLQGEYSA